MVFVVGNERLLGLQLLVQLRLRLGLLAVAQEHGRNEADQQLSDNDEDHSFTESHIVIEQATDERSDEGAQCKGGRPQARNQAVRLNAVREAMVTEWGGNLIIERLGIDPRKG